MKEEIPVNNEKDISLIDLLIVPLRYRKMIVLIVAISVLAAFVYFFFLSVSTNKSEKKKVQEPRIQSELTIQVKFDAGTFDAHFDVLNLLTNPDTIYKALSSSGYSYVGYIDSLGVEKEVDEKGFYSLNDPEEKEKALYVIQQRILANKGQYGESLSDEDRLYAVDRHSRTFTIQVWDNNTEQVSLFLSALTKECEQQLYKILRSAAYSVANSYEDLLGKDNPTDAEIALTRSESSRYMAAKRILDGEADFFTVVGITTIQPDPNKTADQISTRESPPSRPPGYEKKMILIVFAGLFFSILLSFIRQWIQDVKNDPVSMEKIRQALSKE